MRQKLIQRRFGDAVLVADFFTFDVTGFDAGDHVGFSNAESLGDLRRCQDINGRSCTRSGLGKGRWRGIANIKSTLRHHAVGQAKAHRDLGG